MEILHVALTGLAAIVFTLSAAWIASVRMRDASIADICWGPGFALISWLYCFLLESYHPRPLLVAALVTIWGARLGIHIGRRHRGRGEDPRYTAMRDARGPAFWWQSLFVVFWLQGALLWFVALPVLAVAGAEQPAHLTWIDGVGLLLFAVGFAFEVMGDRQLERFRAEASNRGRVLDTGLWRYSRHPNYFGDALLWWGIYVIALATPHGWMTVASPVLMTVLLLRVSGVALLERSLTASKPAYAAYARRTSAFVPWPPRDGRTRRLGHSR